MYIYGKHIWCPLINTPPTQRGVIIIQPKTLFLGVVFDVDHDFEGPRAPKAHLDTVNRNLSHHLRRPFNKDARIDLLMKELNSQRIQFELEAVGAKFEMTAVQQRMLSIISDAQTSAPDEMTSVQQRMLAIMSNVPASAPRAIPIQVSVTVPARAAVEARRSVDSS